MSNIYTKYGQLLAGKGYYAIGKDMLQTLGVTKAIIISILADLDDIAQKQGYDRFFATSQSLAEKTGCSQRTIQRAFDELKADGIIDDGVKGEGLDNRKYYKLDYEKIGKIIVEKLPQTTKDAPDDKGKNTPNDYDKMSQTIMTNCHKPLRQIVINDYDKNSSAFMTNCHKPTYTTNLNLQTQTEQKEGKQKIETPKSEFQTSQKTKMLKDQKEILDILAREVYKLPNKPKGDFELFRAWIFKKVSKNKGITEFTLAKNVKEYAKLDFLANESPDDRLMRAYESGWSGIVFKDDKFIAGGYQAPQIQHDHKHNNANFDKNINALNENTDTREFMTIDEYAKQSKGD